MSPLLVVLLLLGRLGLPLAGPVAAVPALALGPPVTVSHSGAAPPGPSTAPAGQPSALAASSLSAGAGWVYPVGPPGGPAEVVHGFDPPDQPWLAGHR